MTKPSVRAIVWAILFLALPWLLACTQGSAYNTVPMTQAPAAAAAAHAGAPGPGNIADLKLGSGDRIRVNVAGADKLNGDYQVDLSGAVALPLIGVVAAAGKTPKQLEAAIAKLLVDEKLMEHPKVGVALVAGQPFYALGEVKKPGKYPYVAGLNIISAIATAGGFTGRAEQDFVFLRHAGQPNEIKVPIASALPVEPGDIIRVGMRLF